MSRPLADMPKLKNTLITAATATALLAPATAAQAVNAVPEGGGGGAARGVALPKIKNRTPAAISTDNGLRVAGRKAPSTAGATVLKFASGQAVKIVCQKRGQSVTGKFGTSNLWDLVAIGGGRGAYVTDTYVATGSDGRVAPPCGGGGGGGTGPTGPTTPTTTGFPKDVTSAPEKAIYDDAGPWRGKAGCSGGFTKGAAQLQSWLRANFGAAKIEGYSCRQNTADLSKTSIHGVGRASDWYRNASSAADRAIVDRFIKRMSAHNGAMARAMGVQYFIWNRQEYHVNDNGITVDGYGGPVPHTDHVHIEQNLAGAALNTSYWKLAGF